MLQFFAALLIDSPLAIEVNFKDYAECMKTILDYANPDSPYALDATKVVLAFLLAGRRKYEWMYREIMLVDHLMQRITLNCCSTKTICLNWA